jgi:hypothetical protein
VRPDLVVVFSPELDVLLRVGKVHKPVLIEALVPQPAVEALDVAVLRGLGGANEVQRNPVLERPSIERFRDELRPLRSGAVSPPRQSLLRSCGRSRKPRRERNAAYPTYRLGMGRRR